mmetsp:Transcript_20728/g.49260  ORF Transcript_20728/g.49260 Transcript_20728/m.49260 type:complete len:90 (-) Transcript_20728:727-996(-)
MLRSSEQAKCLWRWRRASWGEGPSVKALGIKVKTLSIESLKVMHVVQVVHVEAMTLSFEAHPLCFDALSFDALGLDAVKVLKVLTILGF